MLPAVTQLETLYNQSKALRHPPSATVDFHKIVAQPIGTLPSGTHKFAIVGAGFTGITALLEISKMATKDVKIEVDLYEQDADNFLFKKGKTGLVNAGRISSLTTDQGIIYERGAMRFAAGFLWHYVMQASSPEKEVSPFPSPGKVPTASFCGPQVDYYHGKEWKDPESLARLVGQIVADGLNGKAYYPIGDKSPAEVTRLNRAENTPENVRIEIKKDWEKFAETHKKLTLEAAITHIIKGSIGQLPPIPGIKDKDSAQRITYYTNLLIDVGFGAGSLKPWAKVAFVEIMHDWLWDYTATYTLPFARNVELVEALYRKIQEAASDYFQVTIKPARVSDVFHRMVTNSDEIESAAIAYYPKSEAALRISYYEGVILAIPSKALLKIMQRLGTSPRPTSVEVGDIAKKTRVVDAILPPLLLSRELRKGDKENVRILNALEHLHMAPASKLFVTISKSLADRSIPFLNQPVQAIVSDTNFVATYRMPALEGRDKVALLLSYAWEEAVLRQRELFEKSGGSPEAVLDGLICELEEDFQLRKHSKERQWFLEWLKEIKKEGEDFHFVDWKEGSAEGGFKMDMPGDHTQSEWLSRHYTHALLPSLGARFFIASDCYGALPGWLEADAISNVKAVAGLVLSINKGMLDSLNSEAQKLITEFKCIVEEHTPFRKVLLEKARASFFRQSDTSSKNSDTSSVLSKIGSMKLG